MPAVQKTYTVLAPPYRGRARPSLPSLFEELCPLQGGETRFCPTWPEFRYGRGRVTCGVPVRDEP